MRSNQEIIDQVGQGGVGYIWLVCEGGYEEWRHSVAPLTSERLAEILRNATDEVEISNEDNNILPTSGDLEPDSVEDSDEDVNDDFAHFEKEVHVHGA